MASKVDKNRQKKLAKRKAQSKTKQKQGRQSRQFSKGFAFTGTICDCFASYSEGMMSLYLARKRGALYTVSGIILDLYCLGVKDAFLAKVNKFEYAEIQSRKTQELSPEQAKRVILDGVEYARKLGFEPHKDFKKSFMAYDEIDADGVECEFEFGKDGQPFFFAGPFDSPKKCKKIMETLENSCGKGNYYYVIPDMEFDYKNGRYKGAENF